MVLKFSEQLGTPQNVAASSSLTAQLRSLSKGDSPMASPFQNYSSIHSQSRSVSSPSMQSRSPSISNMAALRQVLNIMYRPDTNQIQAIRQAIHVALMSFSAPYRSVHLSCTMPSLTASDSTLGMILGHLFAIVSVAQRERWVCKRQRGSVLIQPVCSGVRDCLQVF